MATCQAENTVPISRALAGYLQEHLKRPVRFLESAHWQDAYAAIANGQIDIGWICGRPYVQLLAAGAPIQLLAAPVMAGQRYEGRAIYFSDVVVARESHYRRFEDLRGASWAYNEPGSQSGYHITRYHLAQLGESGRFFGRVVGSGGHVRSLDMIQAGQIDASAIDSTVLEWQMAHNPGLSARIRVIDTLGPSPIPPLVVAGRAVALREELAAALLELPATRSGRQLLALGALARFAQVTDRDYEAIRQMELAAKDTSFFV